MIYPHHFWNLEDAKKIEAEDKRRADASIDRRIAREKEESSGGSGPCEGGGNRNRYDNDPENPWNKCNW